MDLQPLVSQVKKAFTKTPVPPGLRLPPKLQGALPVVGHTADFVRDTIGLLARVQREIGEELHLLGYGLDLDDPVLAAALSRQRDGRRERSGAQRQPAGHGGVFRHHVHRHSRSGGVLLFPTVHA